MEKLIELSSLCGEAKDVLIVALWEAVQRLQQRLAHQLRDCQYAMDAGDTLKASKTTCFCSLKMPQFRPPTILVNKLFG